MEGPHGEESGPSYESDAAAYLSALSTQPPARHLLRRLAGTVASSMNQNPEPQIAALYLQASAQQLVVEAPSPTGTAAFAAAAAVMNDHANVNIAESEVQVTKQVYDIVEVSQAVLVFVSVLTVF